MGKDAWRSIHSNFQQYTVRKNIMMKKLARICYAAAYISVPVSVFCYFQSSQDLGIFIGLWAPTLLLSGMLASVRD